MNRGVSIPDIQVRIQFVEHLRIIADRSITDATLTRFILCQLTHPVSDVTTNATLIVKEQDWLRVILCLQDSTPLPDYSNG